MDAVLLRVLLGAGLFFIVIGVFLMLSAMAHKSEPEPERQVLARSLNGQSSPDYGVNRHKRVR